MRYTIQYMNMKYSPELATAYTNRREQMSHTDKPFFDELEKIGVKGKSVIDLGCGPGRHARIIKSLGAARVIGVDINEKMVELAKHATSDNDIHFVVADGQSLPLENRSADIVVSMYVVMYFPDSQKVFTEISRVLKDDGHFVGVFNIAKVEPGFEYLANQKMPIRLGEGDGSIVVQNLIKTPEEIESAIRGAGLVIIEKKEVEDPMARIDESFADKSRVHKQATMFVLQKNSSVK